MKRIDSNKRPNAILVADFHLREDQPICRLDDFPAAQWKKVDFINNLQQKYNCPVLCTGDLFHHWKPSPFLLSETMKHLPDQFHTVYGNHDLPQHNLELANKSGIYTLEMANEVNGISPPFITFVSYGMVPPDEDKNKILTWHVMTYKTNKPFPDCTSPKAIQLLKKYPQYDLIVTGDNHQPFIEEYKGRLLVNPGSLTRQSANEAHKPRVYLWYADTNTVEAVYLPFKEDVVSREHIKVVEERNERIDAFISRLNNDYEGAVSFEENLKHFDQSNQVRRSVMNIVYKSIEQ